MLSTLPHDRDTPLPVSCTYLPTVFYITCWQVIWYECLFYSFPPAPFLKVLCYRPEETGGTWGMNPRNSYSSFFTLPSFNCLFHISFFWKMFLQVCIGGDFIWNLGSQQRFLFVWSPMSWMSVEITSWLASWKLSSLTDWFGPLCKHPCLLTSSLCSGGPQKTLHSDPE